MILHRNPELARNAWLELTPQRLLAMPLVIGMILLVAGLSSMPGISLDKVALTLFVLIVVLWGAKLAGESMTEELSQGTWDSQRLSGLDAASMTVGKLFGGPVFAWYGGAFCVVAYVAASLEAPLYPAVRSMLIAIGLAVIVHSLALLSNLMAWRKLPRSVPAARSNGVMILLALLFVPQVIGLILSGRPMGELRWYGVVFEVADFSLLCVLMAVFWGVLGLYRTMREELAFRDPPTAWISFLLFLFFFVGGWFYGREEVISDRIMPSGSAITAHLGACALLAATASYALLFGERKDWVKLRRILALIQAGESRRAYELIPKWLATFALTAAVSVVFAVAAVITEPALDGFAMACTVLGFLAFLVRDGALVLGLNFTRDQRRADAAAAIYLTVLYALLPALLLALSLDFLAGVFWPPLIRQQPVWLVFGLLQAAAALDFARRRWSQLPTIERG